MADERHRQGMSTNTVIGYIRAIIFLALGSFMITRTGYQFKIVGVLFVVYGIWRVYSTIKRSRIQEYEEKADQ